MRTEMMSYTQPMMPTKKRPQLRDLDWQMRMKMINITQLLQLLSPVAISHLSNCQDLSNRTVASLW
jgi:hypothetical protein